MRREKPAACVYSLCIYPNCACDVPPPPRKWDEGEHEGCGIDSQRAMDRQTLEVLTVQNIQYHDRIRDLEEALQIIARKKKMDATAAASMRAIAVSALSLHKPHPTENIEPSAS